MLCYAGNCVEETRKKYRKTCQGRKYYRIEKWQKYEQWKFNYY